MPMVAFARPEMEAMPAPGIRRMRPNIRQNSMVRKTDFRKKVNKMKKPPKQDEPQQLKVRTEFPESWLWFDEYIRCVLSMFKVFRILKFEIKFI